MTLIILLAIEISSHKPVYIKANVNCEVTKNFVYNTHTNLFCVPNENIFQNSFEQVRL